MCHRAKGRRTTRLGLRASPVCLLAIALSLGRAGTVAASPDPTQSPFFRLSPIQAVTLTNQSGTRYSITVTNAPVGNEPFARWYLDLPAAAADCTNTVLPGGTRLSATRYVWKNQGTSFAWYHGAKGSYAADRAYGCDQTKIGRDGYPGTVTAVFENDSQHCTATFTGIAAGSEPQFGPPPVCDLGGYIPLPVPRSLLDTYAKVDKALTALIHQARSGRPTGPALDQEIASILQPQTAAFERLFPPVWGCAFGSIFNPLLAVKGAIETQIAALTAGKQLSASALAGDVDSIKALDSGLQACRPSSTQPLGVPQSIVRAVDQLGTQVAALGRATVHRALLEPKLRSIDARLNTIITKSFPVVFATPYIDLLDRVIAENTAIALAKQAAANRDVGAAVAALKQVAGHEQTIGTALRKQAKRAAKAEKAA